MIFLINIVIDWGFDGRIQDRGCGKRMSWKTKMYILLKVLVVLASHEPQARKYTGPNNSEQGWRKTISKH